MAKYRFDTHVSAPPERVFDVFTDLRNAADNVTGIKELTVLTEGPIGKGTRFRETRLMMGKEATEEMEITSFVPGNEYSVGCESCGCRWDSTFTFTPEGDGTRVELSMKSKALTFGAKLMSPLGILFSGMVKKCVTQDLLDLKALCEGGVAQPA